MSLTLKQSSALTSCSCSPAGPRILSTCLASLAGAAHFSPVNPCPLLTWPPTSRPHLLQGLPDPSAARCGQCPALRAHASRGLPRSKTPPPPRGLRPAPGPAPSIPLGTERHRVLTPRNGCGWTNVPDLGVQCLIHQTQGTSSPLLPQTQESRPSAPPPPLTQEAGPPVEYEVISQWSPCLDLPAPPPSCPSAPHWQVRHKCC